MFDSWAPLGGKRRRDQKKASQVPYRNRFLNDITAAVVGEFVLCVLGLQSFHRVLLLLLLCEEIFNIQEDLLLLLLLCCHDDDGGDDYDGGA